MSFNETICENIIVHNNPEIYLYLITIFLTYLCSFVLIKYIPIMVPTLLVITTVALDFYSFVKEIQFKQRLSICVVEHICYGNKVDLWSYSSKIVRGMLFFNPTKFIVKNADGILITSSDCIGENLKYLKITTPTPIEFLYWILKRHHIVIIILIILIFANKLINRLLMKWTLFATDAIRRENKGEISISNIEYQITDADEKQKELNNFNLFYIKFKVLESIGCSHEGPVRNLRVLTPKEVEKFDLKRVLEENGILFGRQINWNDKNLVSVSGATKAYILKLRHDDILKSNNAPMLTPEYFFELYDTQFNDDSSEGIKKICIHLNKAFLEGKLDCSFIPNNNRYTLFK